jgi:putative Mg2+ transporter-C (MgtC) family protein
MSPHLIEVAVNLGEAWLAGGLVGMERSYDGRAAGFRTHALVGLAAAAVMIITLEPELIAGAFPGGGPRLDPTRAAQGVMTGVGFIGAGVIFKEGVSVQGLTTAASIWATAALGMLFGLGLPYAGVLTTAAVLITLIAFGWLEAITPGHVYALAIFRFHLGAAPTESGLRDLLGRHDVKLSDVSYRLDDETFEYRGNLRTRSPKAFGQLAERLREVAGLAEYELSRISK